MGTIAGANAFHGFSDDVFGLFFRDGLAGSVHFGKILPKLIRNLTSPLAGNGRRVEKREH